MNKQTNAPLIAGLLLLSCQQAQAHFGYANLGTFTNAGDSASYTPSFDGAHRYSWLDGTDNDLGDSHAFVTGGIKFTLTQAASVQITVTANSALLNPAMSVYSGVFPTMAHDYDIHDDIVAADNTVSYDAFGASATDKRPDDPLIRRYIPAGYDLGGNPLTYDGYNIIYTENPIWNTPDSNLGGLTPAQWYEANYQAHNGYRDTLNFTTLGGMIYNPDLGGWYPANVDLENGPYLGFTGQFDAFGNWSMANEAGEWAEIQYISSVSSTACNGPNCLTTDTGGFSNPGHFAGNDGVTESLILNLGPGVYSIITGGESCIDWSTECRNAKFNSTVTATLLGPVAAVPLPGAFWLMGTALLGLSGLRANRARG